MHHIPLLFKAKKLKEVADAIRSRTQVEYVLYDLSSLEPQVLSNIGLLQISKEELQEARVRLQQALALGPSALSPLIAPSLFNLGPLTEKFNRFSSIDSSEDLCINAFVNGEEDCDTYAQMIIRPKGSPFDNSFSIPFMAEIEQILLDVPLEENGITEETPPKSCPCFQDPRDPDGRLRHLAGLIMH